MQRSKKKSNLFYFLKNTNINFRGNTKIKKKITFIYSDQYLIMYWKADRSEHLTQIINVPENYPGFEWKCNHDIAHEMFLKNNPDVDPNLVIKVLYC